MTQSTVRLLAICAVVACACGTPVGVKRMDPTTVQRQLTRSILTSDGLSNATRNVLFQHDLVERWQNDPAGTIAVVQKAVAPGGARRADIFALAELSFAYAEKANDPAYYRATAVYAWIFLFPSNKQQPLGLLDTRARIAADLYNRGLALGFAAGPKSEFVPHQGRYPMPFGYLDVSFNKKELIWGRRRLIEFVPVAELDVEGLATRYRWSGIGAPLSASTEPVDPNLGYDDHMEPWSKVPVTAVLRFSDLEAELATGRVKGSLTLEDPVTRRSIDIDGQEVPLETETTASLAYTLAESPVWQRELGGFLQRVVAIPQGTQLAALVPYRPGLIPIVLVHGTASSPGRWAEMINELENDPHIGPRIQIWLFTYDTGNPIVYSAMLLRDSLQELVERLDPNDRDPALRDMVVIGHSQGGLLTKMTAIDSGDTFWRLASDRPFEEIKLNASDRATVQKMAFVKPVPSVKRLVFISTPHHGSYIAGSWIAHQAARLILMPSQLAKLSADLLTMNRGKLNARFTGVGTSVMGMTPGQPFIEALHAMPIAPGVKAHSIIAVTDLDAPRDQADDGVVEYKSAHVGGVESERVVLSGHSCQDKPQAIEEVRRIIQEHIDEFDAAHPAQTPSSRTANAVSTRKPRRAARSVRGPGAVPVAAPAAAVPAATSGDESRVDQGAPPKPGTAVMPDRTAPVAQ